MITIGIALGMGIAGFLLFRYTLNTLYAPARGVVGEHRVRRIIDKTGAIALHDFYLEDDRGITQIDHAVLTSKGILLLETKNFSGKLYAQGRNGAWVRYVGGKKTIIPNPVHQNFRHLHAARSVVGSEIPILDLVVLAGGRFPKSQPEKVVRIDDLPGHLVSMGARIVPDDPLWMAWNKLVVHVRRDRGTRENHLRELQRKYNHVTPKWLGWTLLFIAIALLVAAFLLLVSDIGLIG